MLREKSQTQKDKYWMAHVYMECKNVKLKETVTTDWSGGRGKGEDTERC